MSPTLVWVAIAIGELVLLLGLALVVSGFRSRAVRRRDRQAVETLVAKVRQHSAERDRAIRVFLVERFGLADETLDAAAVALLQEELRLYQTFANLYLRRDPDVVAAFDLAVQRAVSPYWRLPGASVPAPAEVGAEAQLAQVEALRAQNQLLSEELQITMSTMTRMLHEYSGMFGDADATGEGALAVARKPPEAQPALGADGHDQGSPAGIKPAARDDAESESPDAMPLSDEATDALLADALGEVDLEVDEINEAPGSEGQHRDAEAVPDGSDQGQFVAR
jgi:hypothetical protein